MIESREIYEAVAKGQPLVKHCRSKLKRVGRKSSVIRSGGKVGSTREVESAGPLTIVKGDGEIVQPSDQISLRHSTCPYPVGRTATLKYREYPDDWQKGDPLPPAEGKGIEIIVTSAEQQDDGRWLIRWERVGPHRPLPAKAQGVFLASGGNYTTSAENSIDPEASVIPSDAVEKMMADELAFKREQQKQKIEAARKAIAPLMDDEELERFGHRFEQLFRSMERDVDAA